MPLWIDGAVDGYDNWPSLSKNWKDHIQRFHGWHRIGEPAFLEKPDPKVVRRFVAEVLNKCLEVGGVRVKWLSIPQLPASMDTSRNKMNRALAEAAAHWRRENQYRGKLILPVVLTHKNQLLLKVERDRRTQAAVQFYQRSGADGYWVAEASLGDQTGAGPFPKVRFPALRRFHEELSAALESKGPSVAGPYWGMNLILWARGVVTHPAMGVGGAYQYHVPNGTARKAKKRIALPTLRRWATVSPQLDEWLKGVPKNDPAYRGLRDLGPFNRYYLEDEARRQVARFYKDWFDTIAGTPPLGRSLALYQDFSTAYVLGKPLADLPDEEKTARRPERVAEQFMLQCL